jgi:hypothetical protein
MDNYLIHRKLPDSQKTTIRDSRGPCRDYVGIIIVFVKNYVIHKKLRDSQKNYMIHEKLADDFLVERNRANLCLHSHYIGIYIEDINEKPCLNWENQW